MKSKVYNEKGNTFYKSGNNNNSIHFSFDKIKIVLFSVSLTIAISVCFTYVDITQFNFSNLFSTTIMEPVRRQTVNVIADPEGRVRAEPNSKSPVITKIPTGGTLYFLEENTSEQETYTVNGKEITGIWLRVEDEKGNEGWIFEGCVSFRTYRIPSAKFVSDTHPIEPEVNSSFKYETVRLDSKSYYAIVNGNGINLRKIPFVTIEPEPTGHAQKNDTIFVIGYSKHRGHKKTTSTKPWYLIERMDENGNILTAWIYGDFIDKINKREILSNQKKASGTDSTRSSENELSDRYKSGSTTIEVSYTGGLRYRRMKHSLSLTPEDEEGRVTLRVKVDKDGKVLLAKAIGKRNTLTKKLINSIEKIVEDTPFAKSKKGMSSGQMEIVIYNEGS